MSNVESAICDNSAHLYHLWLIIEIGMASHLFGVSECLMHQWKACHVFYSHVKHFTLHVMLLMLNEALWY